jgi:hypothetical protein
MNRAAESTGFDEAVPLFKPKQLLAALESDQYPVDQA